MKKGSALLIVLGMLAFMVMSAVAFSMFMRQSRLPSSFLRQRLVSSQLVKAGLAEAMQTVDAAIGDNPYPGIGATGTRNRWRNRVFMGTDTAYQNTSSDLTEEDSDDSIGETVSTMPLEGLAYLPPPLVNSVRYLSRKSSTAVWTPLGYDAGRYVFTCVNVSDYFDINRLPAGGMRDSSAARRISMAYLFENDRHTDWTSGAAKPDSFDAFIKKVNEDSFSTRLVSLADYNLANGSKNYGDTGLPSPFYDYIKNSKQAFYDGYDPNLIKMQKFVTDSWYPSTNTNAKALVLTDDAKGQPFDGKDESLDDLQKNGNEAFRIFRERLDLASLGALYDYVDEDNVPISLAIPTIERAPMLTGIQLVPSGFHIKLKEPKVEDLPDETQGKAVVKVKRLTWAVDTLGADGDPEILFSCCGVYPFKRTHYGPGDKGGNFKAQVMVKVFLSDKRLEDDANPTRDKAGVGYNTSGANWKDEDAMKASDKAYCIVTKETGVSFKGKIATESDTVFDGDPVKLEVRGNALQDAHVYGLKMKTRKDPDTGAETTTYEYDSTGMTSPLYYRSGKSVKSVVEAGQKGVKLYLNYVAWVRVWDGNKTYDLIPARVQDDQVYNGFKSGSIDELDGLSGQNEPILPISSAEVLDITNIEKFKEVVSSTSVGVPEIPAPADQGILAIYCDDPRFNFAPEDWYKTEDGQVRGATWLGFAQGQCNGSDHRSRDIFQFVSDCGYLQSLGELQFVPYLSDFDKKGNPFDIDYCNSGKYNGRFASSIGGCANHAYMWQTHWSFGKDADWRQGSDCDPYNWGISDTGDGPKINPYAEEDIFIAALANTPYDWSVACEENQFATDDGLKLCFNARTPEARVEWEDLEDIATAMRNEWKNSTDWESRYRSAAGWWGSKGSLFGVELDNFHDVDRKYLYSYWKSCFSNAQQLFLFFVRAEPSVMGGASAGHTPSQLGARAVALVWREPETAISDSSDNGDSTSRPHRMRILFYHEFD